MTLFLRNLQHSLRMMFRYPGFTVVAVTTLALGIGANTAIFSVVNAFLLRPLPFKDPNQLVALHAVHPNFDRSPASYPEFISWRRANPAFSDLTALFETTFGWAGDAEPVKIEGAMVAEEFFQTFGTPPLLGRTFLPEEHKSDGHVVIVSESFWYLYLAGRRDVIGRSLMLDGLPYTVVGVMPGNAPDFTPGRQTSLWVPLEPNKPMYAMNPQYHFVRVFGRLKPGVSIEQAQSVMGFVAKRVAREYPGIRDAVAVESLRDVFVARLRAGLIFLLGTVLFLLLIACANIANLLMIRATTRRRELAVRSSLGASRAQLVQQMLAESLVINIFGGALGLLLAILTKHWLLVFWPANISRPYELGIDWRVLGFTGALSLLTGLLFGLGPALIGSRIPPPELLNQGSSQVGFGARQSRFCSFVVVAELALAMPLMVGAGLMVKSFIHLQQVDPGFQAKGVLTAQITLPEHEFRQGTAIYREMVERIQALPEVESVGATTFLPLESKDYRVTIRVEGQDSPVGQEPVAATHLVNPSFFKAMHTPLLAGRNFTERDTRAAPHVVIVNQALANRFWMNQSAVGKHLDSGLFGPAGWQEVVGVVADIKTKNLDQPAELQVYLPYTEFSNTAMTVIVRAIPGVAAAVQKAVWSVHPGLPVKIKTMEEVLQDSVSVQRMVAVLPSFLAICGLALSCMGVYGVTSYVISRRTREIGIRIALGAGPREVLFLVFRQGLSLTFLGAGIGILGSFILTRLLSSWLYGVRSNDAQTFILACSVLSTVAALATYLPARRATRVNAMVALREE